MESASPHVGEPADVQFGVVITVRIAAIDEDVATPVGAHVGQRHGLSLKHQVGDRPRHPHQLLNRTRRKQIGLQLGLVKLTNCLGYAMVRIYPRPVILVQPDDKTPWSLPSGLPACSHNSYARRTICISVGFSIAGFLEEEMCKDPAHFEENFRPEPCRPRFG